MGLRGVFLIGHGGGRGRGSSGGIGGGRKMRCGIIINMNGEEDGFGSEGLIGGEVKRTYYHS